MHLTQLFDLSFRGRADRVGLEYADPSGAHPHADLRRRRRARESHGARARGARVDAAATASACISRNRVEFIDLFLACVRLGVIFVPMNVLYRERELRHIVGDAEPRGDRRRSRHGCRLSRRDSACGTSTTLSAARGDARVDATDRESRRRRSGADHLHVGHHRRREGRGAVAQQSRGERHHARRPCGASPRPIATSRCCRSSTCTGWATAFTVG